MHVGVTDDNIVTYVNINSLEKRRSCKIRGIIPAEGNTAKKTIIYIFMIKNRYSLV